MDTSVSRVVIVGGGLAGLFARRVLAWRPLGEPIGFSHDYLILAVGVRQSYFGHYEYAAFAPGMKTVKDAVKIRRRMFGALEMAKSAHDPAERQR